MSPVSKDQPGTWDTKVETLEAKIPYAVFKKIALSQSVEMQVGTRRRRVARKESRGAEGSEQPRDRARNDQFELKTHVAARAAIET